MKKVIKGITYNTETAEKLFTIKIKTFTGWTNKVLYQKKERKPVLFKDYFVYVQKWNDCGNEPIIISEEINKLSHQAALDMYEEKFGYLCDCIFDVKRSIPESYEDPELDEIPEEDEEDY